MSRDKFEAWFVNSAPVYLTYKDWSATKIVAYEAWLAGRESMRDEAALEGEMGIWFDKTGSEIADLISEAIRKIEP